MKSFSLLTKSIVKCKSFKITINSLVVKNNVDYVSNGILDPDSTSNLPVKSLIMQLMKHAVIMQLFTYPYYIASPNNRPTTYL